MEDHLDIRIGEHAGERGGVEAREGIEELRAHAALGRVDRDLHQAEERYVAALGHELRVDGDPASAAGLRGQRGIGAAHAGA